MDQVNQTREDYEYAPWISNLDKNEQTTYDELTPHFIEQHRFFANEGGIEQILRFLMGTNTKEGYVIEKMLESDYNQVYQKVELFSFMITQT
jgi:hypothetical protein